MAATVTQMTRRDHQVGGRPRAYPDWCPVLFGACIRIFGSASATARALADETIWALVLTAARMQLGEAADDCVSTAGPSRDHWSYFCRRRVTPEVLAAMIAAQRDLAVRRAQEVGLLNSGDAYPAGGYRRDHVVGVDGKVFNSPLRTMHPNVSIRQPGLRDRSARTRLDSGTGRRGRTASSGARSSPSPRSVPHWPTTG
jgi:hypothetical protein